MSADAGADQRAMAALQATVKDLSARLVQLEVKVARLSEPALDRAARGLAEMADKIDAANPDRVPGNSVEQLEARKRLTDVE